MFAAHGPSAAFVHLDCQRGELLRVLREEIRYEMKPLCIDLFCGLGGWSESFLAEGFHCVGFDIEANDYGNGGYPGELVLRDIRSISGAELVKEYGIPACIVASPPCQEFSYMAMPWSKAKEKQRKILADPAEQKRLTDLFNQCFRIQREVSEAAGHYVPMVVENVRGAEKWVGRARWKFGSFYLWGDVPALMPIPGRIRKTPEGSWDQNRKNYNADHQWEGNKTVGMNWSDQSKRGQDFTRIAGQQSECGKAMNISMTYAELKHTVGTKGYASRRGDSKVSRIYSSKSKARKQASAEIAKIPGPLGLWIAKCFKPGT